MTPILFYGVPEGCSFGSIVALEWSGLAYRLCRIEMPAEVAGDTYRRINAVAETPSLLTGDRRIVNQSVAILHHIGAAAPDAQLVPRQGTPAFDRFNEVISFLNTGFFGAFAPLWWAMENGDGPHENAALLRTGQDQVRKAHADLEQMLGNGPWLLGDQRSAADAYLMGIARWNDFHQVLERTDYPRLDRLYQRLLSDPAVRFAHAVEHGEAAQGAGGFRGHCTLPEALAASTAEPATA